MIKRVVTSSLCRRWLDRSASIRCRMPLFELRLAIAALAIALILGASAARAEVRVQGSAAAAQIDAVGASITEVLSSLRAAFDVRYRSPIALDETVHGTYEGSVKSILSRVLAGYNYVISNDETTIEIIVIGRRSGMAVVAPATAPVIASPAAPGNPATQWRTSVGSNAPDRAR